jgi:hypothetical protein
MQKMPRQFAQHVFDLLRGQYLDFALFWRRRLMDGRDIAGHGAVFHCIAKRET